MSRTVRTGQSPGHLDRASFGQGFRERFYDPAFQVENDAIGRLEVIAWETYVAGRKSPQTTKAGPGFADPDYDLSVEWREISDRLNAAQAAWNHTAIPSRVLVINANARNDGTCLGEISKS